MSRTRYTSPGGADAERMQNYVRSKPVPGCHCYIRQPTLSLITLPETTSAGKSHYAVLRHCGPDPRSPNGNFARESRIEGLFVVIGIGRQYPSQLNRGGIAAPASTCFSTLPASPWRSYVLSRRSRNRLMQFSNCEVPQPAPLRERGRESVKRSASRSHVLGKCQSQNPERGPFESVA